MILIEFKWTGFSIKKGKLFGKYNDYTMTTIRLPFLTITIPNEKLSDMMHVALENTVRGDDWYVKNNERIDEYKKELRAEMKDLYEEGKENLRKKNSKLIDENSEHRARIRELEKTVEVMMGIKNES